MYGATHSVGFAVCMYEVASPWNALGARRRWSLLPMYGATHSGGFAVCMYEVALPWNALGGVAASGRATPQLPNDEALPRHYIYVGGGIYTNITYKHTHETRFQY